MVWIQRQHNQHGIQYIKFDYQLNEPNKPRNNDVINTDHNEYI